MTEDEAKTKWCPQSMASTRADYSPCLGSECMAWRVSPALFERTRVSTGNVPDPRDLKRWEPDPDGDDTAWRREIRPAVGYCGLAGAPSHGK